MEKGHFHEPPIRLKEAMVEDIAETIHCLHYGLKSATDLLLDDLKSRALLCDEKIQQAVMAFSEQVQFQFAYDQRHEMSKEVESAAIHLLTALGFKPERLFSFGKAS